MARAIFILVVVASGVAAFYAARHWSSRGVPNAPAPVAAPALQPPPPPVDAGPPSSSASRPIPADLEAGRDLPPLDRSDPYFSQVLLELAGHKAVAAFLNLEGFARRIVATLNNLAGESAAPELWPVRQTAGRFLTEPRDGGLVIAARNGERYGALVRFLESVDSGTAVAAYRRAYPLLERAYEDLGAPGPRFNDRVIAVIDELLATPDVAGPVRVKPVSAEGAPSSNTTARLYLFEDPALENRTAGQKILLRIGPDNARRLKAKLSEIRALLVSGTAR